MKKYGLFIVGLLALLCLCACKAAPPESAITSTGRLTTQPQQHTLFGTVQDAGMNTLTLAAEDAKLYVFYTEPAKIIQTAAPYEIGAQVTVTYLGELDKNIEVQAQLAVLCIEVAAPPAQLAAAAVTQEAGTVPPDPLAQLLSSMTLEEKVGQMFIARCPAENASILASQYHLGGYILFARDFQNQTPETLRAAIQSYQDASTVNLLIGVDEEGGAVNRMSLQPTFRSAAFPSAQALYAQGGFEAIRADAAEKAALLKSVGINVNFAPVCDVSTDPANYIYGRSFGRSPQETAAYVQTVVTEMNAGGMGSVLKHFPGYGPNQDTHTDVAHDPRALEQFRTNDFLPFQAGIAAGAPCVLVSHNIMLAADSGAPASLSPAVHNLLREELGFSGVIITDDLAMGAIQKYTTDANAAVMAVLAGNDMLTCTNFSQQIPSVIAAVQSGQIPVERINDSVLRILKWKQQLGLI